jgi:hypothetical protein
MKPECMTDSNTLMHEMNRADQYLALYTFMRKTAVGKEIADGCLLGCNAV